MCQKISDSQGNKRWGLVIDYQNLNKKTIGNAYLLPNISKIFNQLDSAKYFFGFDLGIPSNSNVS